ncbi:hypothetical protein BO71DRAFT_485317 [Aspergillus ellipticus CBS 707.79]|uniref:Uncharacterized protein n=1 Tax=Aspergillus ellipticus CBS 707.79 TaxID=1448320 RepID=A0A319D582_9EURO|nr:hypothetical protein BO71DRAFT_485317 [Aspergillus ellipticus CBS 707.79]
MSNAADQTPTDEHKAVTEGSNEVPKDQRLPGLSFDGSLEVTELGKNDENTQDIAALDQLTSVALE